MTNTPLNTEQIRRQYDHGELRRSDLAADPHQQLKLWVADAVAQDLLDPTAMALATAGEDGEPAVRIVLLKGTENAGLQFYSDYESQKGRQLAANPKASVMFHWREVNRQLRVSGEISRLTQAASAAYFDSRPELSQWAAMASNQSREIESRALLEQKMNELRRGGVPEKPARWGGYHLQPLQYEFWQGRENRLHDRFSYTKADGAWRVSRLQP